MSDTNRRAVLRSGAALAATGVLGGIAGCSGILGGGGGGADLSYGSEVQGELTDSDDEYEGFRGYFDEYTFNGQSGDTVTITMTTPNPAEDSYLVLEGPNGEQVTMDDDGGPETLESQISSYELPESGTYTIIATSFSQGATFEYTVELEQG